MNIGLDFDGTILDSSHRHVLALRQASAFYQINLAQNQDFLDYKRTGQSTLNYLLSKNIHFKTATKLNQKWQALIENNSLISQDVLYPDTIKFLTQISRNHHLFLVTARKYPHLLKKQLKKLGLKQYFQDVFIVKPSKNAAQLKHEITKNLHLAIIIGDTETDWQWANLSQANFFALNRGFRNQDFWTKKQVISYDNLETIIKELSCQNSKN
jgi:phosphoglycolate phosphatase-like HAD superfamily hydrolase